MKVNCQVVVAKTSVESAEIAKLYRVPLVGVYVIPESLRAITLLLES